MAAFLVIAFRQTYVIPSIPLGLSPGRFLLFAAAVCYVVYTVTRLSGNRSRYGLGVLGPVLTIYFLSTLVAFGTGMTRQSIPIRPADTYLIIEILLVLSVFFYCGVIHNYAGITRVIKGLVAGAVLSATFAIIAHFTGTELASVLRPPGLVEKGAILNTDVFRFYVVRPQGSADHPLELAAVLTIMFPLAVGLTQSLRAGGQRWRLWSVASLVIFVGVGVSVSRSALIGLLAAFVFMACYWPIRRTLLMVGGFLGLAGLFLAVNPSLFKAYGSLLDLAGFQDPSAQYRMAAAQTILSDFSLFGSFAEGAGTSGQVTFDNQYLHRLAETGVFGLIGYVLLLGTSLTLAYRAFANVRNRRSSMLPAASAHLFSGLTASFIAYAVMNIVLDVGGFVQIWTTMWLLLATAAVAYRMSRKSETQTILTGEPADR